MGTLSGTCFCISHKEGNILWSYDTKSPIFGAPCSYDNHIIWPTVSGNLFCLTNKGALKWTFDCQSQLYSSPVIYENLIISGCQDSKLHVIEINSGKAEFKTSLHLKTAISSTPNVSLLKNKVVICVATNNGFLYLIDLKSNHFLCEFQLPNECFSSPCLNLNKIYLGCRDNNLYCIDVLVD